MKFYLFRGGFIRFVFGLFHFPEASANEEESDSKSGNEADSADEPLPPHVGFGFEVAIPDLIVDEHGDN